MGQPMVNGALLMCSFGVAPSALVVPPAKRTMANSVPVATIIDTVPMVNILPFGLCTSLANPMVAAATAAALGVLTPMPCVPVTVGPWIPGIADRPVRQHPRGHRDVQVHVHVRRGDHLHLSRSGDRPGAVSRVRVIVITVRRNRVTHGAIRGVAI